MLAGGRAPSTRAIRAPSAYDEIRSLPFIS